MKLHTKFALLITGTVLVPVTALAVHAFLLVTFLGDGSENAGPKQAFANLRVMVALHHIRAEGGTADGIVERLRSEAPSAAVLVYDGDGRLIRSTTASDSLADLLGSNPKRPRYTIYREMTPSAAGVGPLSVVVAYPGRDFSPGPFQAVFLVVLIGCAISFMAAMSLVIIRSIDRSIAALEAATRRVADGDLDFELEAKGNDGIASLVRSFEAMRVRVREEAAARSRFILAISHDLKTPLASIVGYADALADGTASTEEKRARSLSIIRGKAAVLEDRIAKLIAFAKMETEEWKSTLIPTPLAPFLEEIAADFSAEAELRGFPFRSSIDAVSAPAVLLDADLVRRALENLVQNAFRFAEKGSAIRFEAVGENGDYSISVSNRGETIDPGDLPFIFEPFYRGSRSRRETGFGLGLSVVKSVVAGHGWSVSARSEDGETRFEIRVPAAAAEIPARA